MENWTFNFANNQFFCIIYNVFQLNNFLIFLKIKQDFQLHLIHNFLDYLLCMSSNAKSKLFNLI